MSSKPQPVCFVQFSNRKDHQCESEKQRLLYVAEMDSVDRSLYFMVKGDLPDFEHPIMVER